MVGLSVIVAFVALATGINAQVQMMVEMSASIGTQCWAKPETNLSEEWFRWFGTMNPKVLEESDDPQRKVAWKWVACFYEGGGMTDKKGNIQEDVFPSIARMCWPKVEGDAESEQHHDNALSILRECNVEATNKYTEPEEKVFHLYKCAIDKGIPTPPLMKTHEFYMDLNKKCLTLATDMTKDDFVSFIVFEQVPLTDGQLTYAECIVEEGYAKDGKAHVDFGHQMASLVHDESRRKEYTDAYVNCLKACDHCKETYDLPEEKEGMKEFIAYVWPCILNNMTEITWDDLVPQKE